MDDFLTKTVSEHVRTNAIKLSQLPNDDVQQHLQEILDALKKLKCSSHRLLYEKCKKPSRAYIVRRADLSLCGRLRRSSPRKLQNVSIRYSAIDDDRQRPEIQHAGN